MPVSITRTSDVTINPNDRVKSILNAYGNNSDVIVLSNHLNAGGGKGRNVGKVSSVLLALKQKNFSSKLKFFFLYIVKSLFRS